VSDTFRTSRASWLTGLSAAAVGATSAKRAVAQDLVPITVASGLVEGHAQAHYAVAQGFFRKRGLDVHVLTQNNGAAVAAAVVGGSAQFGISNILQLAQAHANNVPLAIVALATISDAHYPLSALIVAASSGITNGKGLNDKAIGGSSLHGLDNLETLRMIDKQGGDSKSVRFVELPPSASLEALLQGRVTAVVAVPPQLEVALANDRVHSLGDVQAAIAPLWVPAGWFSTPDYLQKNGDIARRFAAAIYDGGAWAMANRAAAAEVLSKALNTAVPQTYQRFATKTDPALLQPPLDVAAHYGFVAPTKARDLMWGEI
jgi:NitT/TauT family transport system substrate-binding protein